MPWPLVVVHWKDAFDGENGWTDTSGYRPSPAMVATVGWMWEGCLDGYVTVVNSYFPDDLPAIDTVGMPVHIPVGMVDRIVLLDQPNFSSAEVAPPSGV